MIVNYLRGLVLVVVLLLVSVPRVLTPIPKAIQLPVVLQLASTSTNILHPTTKSRKSMCCFVTRYVLATKPISVSYSV